MLKLYTCECRFGRPHCGELALSRLCPFTSPSMATEYTGAERWHVQVGPDDIKIMNLEQLDDAFRLDLISERTMVWTKGLGQWKALGVVLSDTESEEEIEEVEPELLPASPQLNPFAGQVAVLPFRVVTSAPPQAPRPPAPPQSVAPRSVPPQSFAPQSTLPQSFAPQAAAPQGPFSVMPTAFEIPSQAEVPRNPRAMRPVAFAIAALGLVFGLHRHGVPLAVASAVGAAPAQLAKAKELSATELNTPLGVRLFVEQVRAQHRLDDLSKTRPVGSNQPETLDADVVEPLVIASALPEPPAPAARRVQQRGTRSSSPPLSADPFSSKRPGAMHEHDPLNPSLP